MNSELKIKRKIEEMGNMEGKKNGCRKERKKVERNKKKSQIYHRFFIILS